MLVCPQCQFENPTSNKFCQQCGTSLTHKPCQGCGANVPFGTNTCPHCDAFTGTVWWAIITEQIEKKHKKADGLETSRELEAIEFQSSLPFDGQHLETRRRYQWLPTNEKTVWNEMRAKFPHESFQGRVIDNYPLEKSALASFIEQSPAILETIKNNLETSPDSVLPLNPFKIPELALPYLTLQPLSPTIPLLHDAWQEADREIILLPDRSTWPLLSELFANQQLTFLEIIHWFNEIATTWQVLSQASCCQSLLIADNLRVDEDRAFGLQQLYSDPPNTQLTLQNLGQMLQRLLETSSQNSEASLAQLFHQINQGEITTITQLQVQIQALADKRRINDWLYSPNNLETTLLLPELPAPSLNVTSMQIDENSEDKLQREMFDSSEEDDLPTAVLPIQLLSLTDAGYTDIGRQRQQNEDYFSLSIQIQKQQSNQGTEIRTRGLYIICDGMGGHTAGEVASTMAVESLEHYFKIHWQDDFPDRETICQGVLETNQGIYKINQQNDSSGSGRMGTTLVMALVQDTKVAIAHVGDSRLYRVNRNWGLEQLTVDHEVGQRDIQRGVDPKIAYSRPDAYQLTQALGPHDNTWVKPDIRFLNLQEDTLLLLCSDGLSDNGFVETHWQTYLHPLLSSNTDLDQGLRKLIDFANQQNGHDNITGILIRVKVRPHWEQPLY
jgi:protein phosphatase